MRALTAAGVAALIVSLALSSASIAADERPMTGRFSATVAPTEQRCGPDALTIGFEIMGVASHLGALTGSGSNCTELTLATGAVAIWDGLATFTAADGSTLTSTSTGMQAAPVLGLATFTTTHEITGGTGRFDDAAGTWIVSGTIDFVTGEINGRVTGSLIYDARP
jgi:hypothetical protein